MADFFMSQTDYVSFFYGVAFILLAVPCLILASDKSRRLPWILLGLFGTAHGFSKFLDIVAFSLTDKETFRIVPVIMAVLSYVLLAEFGRGGIVAVRGRGPGRWVLVPLLALSAFGLLKGPDGLKTASAYALALPGGILASAVLFIEAGGPGKRARKWLFTTAAAIGLYSLSMAAVSPSAHFFPASVLNDNAFFSAAFLPVQMVRGILGLMAAFSLWIFAQISVDGETTRWAAEKRRSVLPVLMLIAIILAGWFLTQEAGNYARSEDLKEGGLYVGALRDHLEHVLQDTRNRALEWSQSPLMRDALLRGSPADIAVAKSLLDVPGTGSVHHEPYGSLFDRDNRLVAACCDGGSVSGNARRQIIMKRPGLFLNEEGTGVFPFEFDPQPGDPPGMEAFFSYERATAGWSYFVSIPVREGGGRAIGTISVKEQLGGLEESFRKHPYCFLIDRNGIIFLSSSERFCLKSLWPLAGDTGKKIAASGQFGPGPFMPLFRSEVLNGDYVVVGGLQLLATRGFIGHNGWSLLILSPMAHIAAYRLFSIFTTFVVLILTVLAYTWVYFTKASASRIAVSERRYRGLIEASSNCIVLFEQHGLCLTVNRAGLDLIGCEEQDVVGKRIDHLWRRANGPDMDEIVQRLAEGTKCSCEVPVVRPDGHERVWQLVFNPICDTNGCVSHFVGIFTDVTDRKRAEEALRLANEELEKRVGERTSELAAMNDKLLVEVAERRLSENALRLSEEKYRNLVELTPDIIYLTNVDGKVIFINNASSKILDAAPDEVIGNPLSLWVHPDDRERTREKLREIADSGVDASGFENRFVSRKGSVANVLHNVRGIRNEKGEIIGLHGIANNITERIKAEEALREINARLDTLIQAIPDVVYFKDTEGRYMVANEALAKFSGLDKHELVGKTGYELMPADLADKCRESDEATLRSGASTQYEESFIGSGGERRFFDTVKAPIRDNNGEIAGLVGVSRDITARRRAEEVVEERASHLALGADVGASLTRGSTMATMLQGCAEAIVRHLDAAFARLWIYNDEDEVLELKASAGLHTHLGGPHSRVPLGALKIGGIARDRKPHVTNAVIGDPLVNDQEWAKREGIVSFAGHPLVVGDKLVGVMALFSRNTLSEAAVTALGSVADVIALGVERKRSEDLVLLLSHRNELILSSAGEGIYGVDLDGRTTFINPAAARMLRWEPDELIGRPPHALMHHTRADGTPYPKEECLVYAAFRDASVHYATDEVFWRKDGSAFPVEYVSTPIMEGEKAVGAVVVFRDITERKRAEEALNEAVRKAVEEKNKTEAVVAAIGDGISIQDIDYKIVYQNKVHRDLLGEHPGEHCYAAYAGRDHVCEGCHLRQSFEDGKVHRKEQVITRGDRTTHIEIISSPLKDSEGRIIAGIELVRDVTDRKKAEENLKLFSMAISEAMDGVQIVDLEGHILYSNRAVEEIYGFSSDELAGRHVDEMNVDKGVGAEVIIPSIRETGRWSGEVMVLHKSGREFPIWLSTSIVADDKGKPIAMVGIIRDMTERKQTEEELKKHREHLVELVEERTVELKAAIQLLTKEISFRKTTEETLKESEAKFRKLSQEFHTLLDAIPDYLLLLSPDLRVMWSNKGAESVMNRKGSEITGGYCYELMYNRHAPCGECYALRSFASGKAERSQVLTHDGRILDARAFPLRDERGEIGSVMVVTTDITERAALEAEAMRAAHLASLGELAAGVAHEINNPINGIINYGQLLVNRLARDSRESDIAGRIMKEGDRIAGIVRGLLSFARERKEEKTVGGVAKILSDTFVLTEAQIRKDGIRLETEIPQDLPDIVANPQQLQQVFLNVIGNARYALNQKYSGTHEDKLLRITCEKVILDGSDRVRITLYDQGMGIRSDILDKVLNPFFSTKPSGEGTGLGLSISHGIVKDHGGKLTVESSEGTFTRVIIDLPPKEDHGD